MSIPGSVHPLFLGASGQSSGYQIERSLRFNSDDSAYLSWTPASAGNRKTWTWAGWVKRSKLNSGGYIFTTSDSNNNSATYLYFNFNYLRYWDRRSSADGVILQTNADYRDPSAWYHLVLSVDYSAGTSANRAKLFVNGVEQTYATASYPETSENSYVNATVAHFIQASPTYFNGYLAEIHFIDGQALDPTSFGFTDGNGIWQPKAYTGTYGTNGFKLNFADNSTAAALGTDTSGNGNTWTVNIGIATTTVCGEVAEDSTLTLTAPAGYVFTSVTFASYGTPTGDCSTGYSIGGCHASNSQSIVEGYLIGNNSGSIPATNAVFGDPCSGIGKKLAVSAVASPTAGNDSLVDTPTPYGTDTGVGGEVRGNYATLNPLNKASQQTVSDGNLKVTSTSGGLYGSVVATIGVSSGKWYWEQTLQAFVGADIQLGIGNKDASILDYIGSTSRSYGFSSNNTKWNNGSGVTYTTSWVAGDIIGLAFDADAGTLTLYRNGSSLGTAFSSIPADTYFPMAAAYSSASTSILNFGQRPFAYTAPSGFKALCTTNIPEGTITTSGTFTGNANADGPFVYLNGVPTAMTINGNAVTFATHADKLSNGFKVRDSTSSYNQSGSNTFSVTSTGAKFKVARAQSNP